MAKRFSASQFRSKLRQIEQKQHQAINRYNQKVRAHNQKVRNAVRNFNSAIDRHNQKVRAHNARLRANRSRLGSLIAQFNRNANSHSSSFVSYRNSTEALHQTYSRFESRVSEGANPQQYYRFVDLAERETENSLEVANQLEGLETAELESAEDLLDAELGDKLLEISPDLNDRWKGALFSLSPQNPDAARHFCTSVREIFTQILEICAPDDDVFSVLPEADRTERGAATRRSKIRYLLHKRGMLEPTLEEFVDANIQNVLELFHVFNDGTHGSAGKFGASQLSAIKKRVEDGIEFLTEIVGVCG